MAIQISVAFRQVAGLLTLSRGGNVHTRLDCLLHEDRLLAQGRSSWLNSSHTRPMPTTTEASQAELLKLSSTV